MVNRTTVYHIEAHRKGWQVRKEGETIATEVARDKEDVIDIARDLAKNRKPSEIVVKDRYGEELDRHSYGFQARKQEEKARV